MPTKQNDNESRPVAWLGAKRNDGACVCPTSLQNDGAYDRGSVIALPIEPQGGFRLFGFCPHSFCLR